MKISIKEFLAEIPAKAKTNFILMVISYVATCYLAHTTDNWHTFCKHYIWQYKLN